MNRISRWQQKTSNPWLKAMIGGLPVLMWVNLVRLAFAILIIILNETLASGSTGAFVYEAFALTEWNIVILVVINTIFLAEYFLHRSGFLKKGTVKILGTIFGFFLAGMFIDFCYQIIGPYFDIEYDISLNYFEIELPAYMTNTVNYTLLGIVASVPVLMQHQRTEKHRLELKVKELEMFRLEQLKDKAKLESLHARINPHFLYNSLNSIVSLVHLDADKAEEMILALSELFRYSLHSSKGNYATVEEELKMARIYLDIEKIRFGDQLKFVLISDTAARKFLIPKFIIQPLVENAIKHGTSHVEKGEITLEVKLDDDKLYLTITDNGPDFKPQFATGYGLLSVQEKLDLLFPGSAKIEIVPADPKKITLTFSQLVTDESAL
ncbi:histidine kinase [bacterium SCSIO 12741]|nr:histidine kinase [bacterium SCSIO 12741]